MAGICRVAWLGRLAYAEGLRLQQALVAARQAGRIPDTLLLLEHPPVFTLGKRREAAERNLIAGADAIRAFGATVEACDRGGDVTYHGPGQLVAYPIIHLQELPQPGVRRYVEGLEDVMIATAAAYGLAADGRRPEETGAWIGERKLGAVGVRINQRVTSHGLALNVCTDLSAFELIVPCGLRDKGVTSIARELGARARGEAAPTVVGAAAHLERAFGAQYARTMVRVEAADVLALLGRSGSDAEGAQPEPASQAGSQGPRSTRSSHRSDSGDSESVSSQPARS
jgi:lipoyl(octanoyl) transferase